MSDLKPCPFCGNQMTGYPDYTISFKRDKRKIYGVYHEICTLHCNKCTCTIQQAGATREEAEKHVYNVWNKRVPEDQPMLVLSPDLTDEQVRELFKKYAKMQPTVVGSHLTDLDLMELRDRFGKEVADVVADMIYGEEKRWHKQGDDNLRVSNLKCKNCSHCTTHYYRGQDVYTYYCELAKGFTEENSYCADWWEK